MGCFGIREVQEKAVRWYRLLPCVSTYPIRIVCLMLLFMTSGLGIAAPQEETSLASTSPASSRDVILLNSYHRGFRWTDQITESVIEAFEPYVEYELYVEHLDAKRKEPEVAYQQMLQHIRSKYNEESPELLLVSDNHALEFVRRHWQELNIDCPVIFCGINDYDPSMTAGIPEVTGVFESTAPKETIALALNQNPDVTQVVVVADNTKTGSLEKEKAIREITSSFPDLEVITPPHGTIDQLKSSVAVLPENSVVLMIVYNEDAAGCFFQNHESAKILSQASPVPVYGLWSFYLDYGVVGGHVVDPRNQGALLSELALHVMKRNDGEALPEFKQNIPKLILDGSVMAQFEMPLTAVPEEAELINPPIEWTFRFQSDDNEKAGINLDMFHNSGVPMLIIRNKSGAILDGNPAALSFYGYTRDELLDITIYEINTHPTSEIRAEFNAAKQEGRKYFNFKHRLSNNEMRDVIVHHWRIKHEDETILLVMVQDETDRKQAELNLSHSNAKIISRTRFFVFFLAIAVFIQIAVIIYLIQVLQARKKAVLELKQSESLYRLLAERIHDVVFVFSPEGENFTYFSPSITNLTGYTVPEAIAISLVDLLSPESHEKAKAFISNRMKVFQEGVHVTDSEIFELYRKDGSIVWVEMTSWLGNNPETHKPEIIASIRDINERRKAEQELNALNQELIRSHEAAITAKRDAEKASEAKGNFLANISHEIRTPMNAIIAMSDLLMEGDLKEQERFYIDTLQSSSNSLMSLISDILDLTKIETGSIDIEPHPFCINSMVGDISTMVAMLASEKCLQLTAFVDPTIPSHLIGDSEKLQQVLLKLLENAIKFTDYGEVVLKAELSAPVDEHVTLRFSVRDTGVGINPKELSGIFEKFSQVDESRTRKHGGCGLGLAICRHIVNCMGGELSVWSNKTEGSEFYFEIKLAVDKPSSTLNQPFGSGKLILLCDQDLSHSESMTTWLKHWGYTVKHAKNAEELKAHLIHCNAQNTPIDYGFYDLETLAKNYDQDILELGKDTKWIRLNPVLTDFVDHTNLTVAADLIKPFAARQFIGVIKDLTPPPTQPEALESSEENGTASTDRKVHILIAEDNRTNQLVVKQLMKQFGYQFTIAPDGSEVIRLLKKERFDLILMDIQMPIMDGIEATKIIRDPHSPVLEHDTPIIALTAHSMKGDREHILSMGLDDYISKPIKKRVFHEKLKNWLSF